MTIQTREQRASGDLLAGSSSQVDLPVSIIVPVYNESQAIEPVIAELHRVVSSHCREHEIIIVDDGSTDGTADLVRGDQVTVIQHSTNKGYGSAIKTGIRHAAYETLVIVDGDGTYPVDVIPEMICHMAEYDMVVGARIGKKVSVPLARRPAKWFLGKLANYLAETTIPDLNSGLRVMKKSVVESFLRMLPSGFSFTTTITLAMLVNDYRIKYIPIEYYQRHGKSKISPVRDTVGFIQLIIRTILLFNPLKVTHPLSLILFGIGGAKIVFDVLTYEFHIATSTIVLLLAAFEILLLGYLADIIVVTRR